MAAVSPFQLTREQGAWNNWPSEKWLPPSQAGDASAGHTGFSNFRLNTAGSPFSLPETRTGRGHVDTEASPSLDRLLGSGSLAGGLKGLLMANLGVGEGAAATGQEWDETDQTS